MNICGFHAIEQALSKKDVDGVLLFSDPGKRAKTIIELARNKGISVRQVKAEILNKLETPDVHKGLILQTTEDQKFERANFSEEMDKLKDKSDALILILDGLTDPHNLGAVIRTCDVFQVDLVVLPEHGTVKVNETVIRISSGAAHHVPICRVTNLNSAIEIMKDQKFWIYGADAGGTDIHKADIRGRTVIIMGNEGKGLHKLVEKNCDMILSIPVLGHVDSLNVSVAAGILIFEKRRQDRLQ